MSEKKIKNLKGFTLVEMVIVVALFAMLTALALGLLTPLSRVYKNAMLASDKESISENMRMYVEDQLQYADRLEVYTNMSMSDAHIMQQIGKFREKYYFTAVSKNENIDGEGLKMVDHKRVKPSDNYQNEIYVLKLDNPDTVSAFEGSVVTADGMYGKITLEKYTFADDGTYTTSKRTWGVETDYYDDYAFAFNIQSLSDTGNLVPLAGMGSRTVGANDDEDKAERVYAKNFAIGLSMYKKTRNNKTKTYTADSVFLNRTISFRLKNILNSDNNLSYDIIDMAADPTYGFTPDTVKVPRFTWYDSALDDAEKVDGLVTDSDAEGYEVAQNDVTFIFTKSPKIENLL